MPTAGRNLLSLREAINSVITQEYNNFELVIIIDGKNDAASLINEIKDQRIIFIEAERWGDPVRLREIGIEKCQGDYLCFLDDDDILYPNHISTLIQYSDDKTIPFSRAMYVFKQPGKADLKTTNIEPNNPKAPYYQPEFIFQQNIAPISSFLIQKSMHYAIGGFDKNLVRLEDWDYWARMSLRYELKFIDVITNEIRMDFSKDSRTIRTDLFKDLNKKLGEKIKDRLNYMKLNSKLLIDEEVKKNIVIPKVSVLMPIYNAQEFLKEAIDSILNQTFRDFELLLINDGSTDKSKDIIENYRDDKRVRIFHKKNEGITKTLNFGLAQSFGRYIARMDADDISMPERLQLQVDYLDNHRNVGLLGTRFKAFNINGEFIENLDVELTNEELQKKILESCRFGHPTVMMRRSVLEAVGVYDESAWAYTVEDYDLWLRIAEKFEIANLPQYLLHYRVNPNSITQSKKEINQKGTKECIRRAKERRALISNTFVSICIPTYKLADHLRKALNSILIQTHKNYEVIITDDTPDSSIEDVYNEFKDQMTIKYYRNDQRKGSPENWNEAMRRAQGEYIKILHHDDWFPEKDSLAKFVSMLDRNQKADFAFSSSANFTPDGKLHSIHQAGRYKLFVLRKNPKILYAGNFIGAPSATIFRKKINLYFDPQFKWVVDYDFYLRVLEMNNNFEYSAEPLIAISMESPEKVTADCLDNKEVEIGEYLKLVQKNNSTNVLNFFQYIYVWYLLDKFKIKNLEDVKKISTNISIKLKFIIDFKNNKVIYLFLNYLNRKNDKPRRYAKYSLVIISWVISYIKKLI